MKNKIVTLVFILTSGFVFAQVNTEKGQDGKIKYSDKSILKTGDSKKTETPKPVVAEETEPVIIQRLEYKSEENIQPKNEVKVEQKSNNPEVLPVRTIEDEISEIDRTIEAIDIKVNVIKNDKVENKKALESGWYDQMAEYRKTAVAKKEVLINSKK